MFKAFLLQSWYNLSDPGLKVRSAVERVFGTLKRHYGMERVHYVGLMRNRAHLILMGICYNLKKMLTLEAA
jgi:IS5 family transposase